MLECMDRLPGNGIGVTHQAVAHMLGVRRESVTEALGRLEAARLVLCGRGRVTVLDGPRLEARTCECYGTVRDTYRRLRHGRESRDADRLLVA